MNGSELIDYIAIELEKEDIRVYDSAIIQRLESMTAHELNKLIQINRQNGSP